MTSESKKFKVFHFSQPTEEHLFSERNAELLNLLPDLNNAMDSVFKHTVTANREGLTVFMLGRRCSNDLAEIFLLASNGYGFAALGVLRSMFEKFVDATYLHQHPDKVDAFWNYYFIQLEKLGWEDIAESIDPNWHASASEFKKEVNKRKRTQQRWAKENLVQAVKDLGLEAHLKSGYYLPNVFIHNSAAEILFGLKKDTNGRFTPVDSNNPSERGMADLALRHGIVLLLNVLDLEIKHYAWDDSKPVFQVALDKITAQLQSLVQNGAAKKQE
jgi:hypothetical protein